MGRFVFFYAGGFDGKVGDGADFEKKLGLEGRLLNDIEIFL